MFARGEDAFRGMSPVENVPLDLRAAKMPVKMYWEFQRQFIGKVTIIRKVPLTSETSLENVTESPQRSLRCRLLARNPLLLRPISVLRFWISEGLTQA